MHISVITDEISQNPEYAFDFLVNLGINHIELRSMWEKNIINIDQNELQKIINLINERDLKVSCLATPIFKCFLNGSEETTTGDRFFVKEEKYEEHLKILSFSLKLAKIFKTNIIRIFSFWKLRSLDDDKWNEIIKKFSHAINLSKDGIILALENEHTCNICDTNLISKFFNSVDNSKIKLLWDPCNSLISGINPLDEYEQIKNLICHVHIKNVIRSKNNQYKYTTLSDGIIDYKTLIRKLIEDNYEGAISVESHVENNRMKENILKDSIIFLKEIVND